MGAKDVRTPSNEAERESLLFRLSATTARELDMLPDVVPRAMGRYREEVERMEQLGDSPRPQHVIRARNALRTLLGDIYLQPKRGPLNGPRRDAKPSIGAAWGRSCYRW